MRTRPGDLLLRASGVLVLLGLVALWIISRPAAGSLPGGLEGSGTSTHAAAPSISNHPSAAASQETPHREAFATPVRGRGPGLVRQLLPDFDGSASLEVDVRFVCATLGAEDAAPVWQGARLEVRVETESGTGVAVCTAPWRAATLGVPRGQDRFVARARGYLPQTVELSRCPRSAAGVLQITLHPDATLELIARHLPVGSPTRYLLDARLPAHDDNRRDSSPRFVGFEATTTVAAADPTGELRLRLALPSGIPLGATLAVHGFSTPAALAPQLRGLEPLRSGETRECVFDVGQLLVLRGRVVGLPAPAIDGQRLRVFDPSSQQSFTVTLDSGGEFAFAGPGGPVEIRLQTFGAWPALRVPGTDTTTVMPEPDRFVVLEPTSPVFGVIPVEHGELVARPFGIAPRSVPESQLDSKIPLFSAAWPESALVHFRVQGTGSFTCRLAGRRPGAGGLIPVEVPAPGGTVVVTASRPTDGTWRFALRLDYDDGPPHWLHPETDVAGRWVFGGVPAGDALLVVGRHGTKAAAVDLTDNTPIQRVAVRSEQTTTVRVQLPTAVVATAEVRGVGPWIEAYGPLDLVLWSQAPVRSLEVPKSGCFALTIFDGWQGPRRALLRSKRLQPGLQLDDWRWDPIRRHLLIACPPPQPTHIVRAGAIAGGGLWLRVYQATDAGRRDGGTDVLPQAADRFELQCVAEDLDVMLMENAFDAAGAALKVVRGWERIRGGAARHLTLAPTGRWVTVRRASFGSSELRVHAPLWWRNPVYAWSTRRLQGPGDLRLWLPADAQGLWVDGRELAAAEIGKTLEVGPAPR